MMFAEYKKSLLTDQRLEIIWFSVLFVACAVAVLVCYPYPFFIEDSLEYIRVAEMQVNSGIRPFGYSIYLGAIHLVSSSLYSVIIPQFAMNLLSGLFLVTTIKFFFPPKSRILSLLFSAFVLLGPSVMYVNTWVMTEALFIAITLIWLAVAIWFLKTKSWWLLIPYLACLFVLASLRYVGIVLGGVSVLTFLLVRDKSTLVAAVLALLVGGGVYFGTKKHFVANYGTDTLSGMSGRARLAGVGLMFPHLPEAFHDHEFEDFEMGVMHGAMKWSYRNAPDCFKDEAFFHAETEFGGGPYFVWGRECPPKITHRFLRKHERTRQPKSMLRSSVVHGKYASHVIKAYPGAYLRHFILPNAQRVVWPNYLLQGYKFKDWKVKTIIRRWFDVDESVEKFEARFDFFYYYIRPMTAQCNAAIFVMFFAAVASLLVFRKRSAINDFEALILGLFGAYVLVYVGFALIGHPVNMRQLLPLRGALIGFIYIAVNRYIGSWKSGLMAGQRE